MDKRSPKVTGPGMKGLISSYATVPAASEKIKKQVSTAAAAAPDQTLLEIRSMFENLTQAIGAVQQDLQKIANRQDQMDNKLAKLDKDQKSVKKRVERLEEQSQTYEDHHEQVLDAIAMQELKACECSLRIRGLKEGLERESLISFIANMLAGLLKEQDLDIIHASISSCFRINSAFARQKKVPRDCIVQFVAKTFKEIVLKKQYETPIVIEGKKILMMKEIPGRLLRKRKEFNALVVKLKNKGTPFRWLFPKGVSFYHKSKRHYITDAGKVEQFLRKYAMRARGTEGVKGCHRKGKSESRRSRMKMRRRAPRQMKKKKRKMKLKKWKKMKKVGEQTNK
nr:PREDICTED: uncharacterized protein LOC103279174 [Anolis carolinensis]|eukprot:XP_008111169.1 PREDICTED: uncharacterized protein LOC103279174 [Anolis carolinensis]